MYKNFNLDERYRRELILGEYYEGLISLFFSDRYFVQSTFQYQPRGIIPQLIHDRKGFVATDLIFIDKETKKSNFVEVKYKTSYVKTYRGDGCWETGIDLGDMYNYVNLQKQGFKTSIFFVHDTDNTGVFGLKVKDYIDDFDNLEMNGESEKSRKVVMKQGQSQQRIKMMFFNVEYLTKICSLNQLFKYKDQLFELYPHIANSLKTIKNNQ